MVYGPFDSIGTDADLPPSHQNKSTRGGCSPGNGRPIVGLASYPRVENDMEIHIRKLEQEAYTSVLRAFKAQSDSLTLEKASLLMELRKELRVTNEDHRELLGRVNADGIIRRLIREWRQTGEIQNGVVNYSQPTHDTLPNPTVSASCKRQRVSQPLPSLSFGALSPTLHPQPVAASIQPPLSSARKGTSPGSWGKKTRSDQTPPGTSMKSMQYPSAGPSGRGPVPNRFSATEPAKPLPYASVFGRKVMNNDKSSSENIRWEGEKPASNHQSDQGAPTQGIKKSRARGGAINGAGRGRGSFKNQLKNFPPAQNRIGKRSFADIKILHTETLIKEVERVYAASHPDPLEIQKAEQVLKENEQSLVDAILRLADASDVESEDVKHQSSRVPSIDEG